MAHPYFSLVLVFSLLLPCFAGAQTAEFRQLSNPAGQTILARPVGVFGDQVRIEFKDGRQMTVSTDVFVEKDAAYLRDWAIVHLGQVGQLIEVEVSRKEDKIREYAEDVPLVGGGVREGALEVEEYKGYYEIKIENRSQFTLNPLRVEYRIFSEEEKQGATKDDEAKYIRRSGQIDYVLKPHEEQLKPTESVEMVETELKKGVVWAGGGDQKSKAKMMGVWVRVYYGKAMIHEYALPSSLTRREVW